MVLAQERLQQAIRLDPDRANFRFYLAYCQDELGQIQPAIRSLQMALDLKPSLASAKLNMAVAYVKLGDFREALSALRSICKSDTAPASMIGKMLTDTELLPLTQTEPWKSRVYELFEERVQGFIKNGETAGAVKCLLTALQQLKAETEPERRLAIESLAQEIRSEMDAGEPEEWKEKFLKAEQEMKDAWSRPRTFAAFSSAPAPRLRRPTSQISSFRCSLYS